MGRYTCVKYTTITPILRDVRNSKDLHLGYVLPRHQVDVVPDATTRDRCMFEIVSLKHKNNNLMSTLSGMPFFVILCFLL